MMSRVHLSVTLWQAPSITIRGCLSISTRLIGNIAFGGAIVGAYAAFRFLAAKTQQDKAHYDWMGIYGQFYRAVRTHSVAIRRLLVGTGNLYVQPDNGVST